MSSFTFIPFQIWTVNAKMTENLINKSMTLKHHRFVFSLNNSIYLIDINMLKFFLLFIRYSYRHKRLIQLLEQLKKSIDEFNNTAVGEMAGAEIVMSCSTNNEQQASAVETPSTPPMSTTSFAAASALLKTSPSIDFFMLYLTSNSNATASCLSYLDKEWYYNIVNSACSYSTPADNITTTTTDLATTTATTTNSALLKSKQCALMLSNLDFSNIMSILSSRQFRLSILRECILLGAHRTQVDILKLPEVLKQAATSGANLSLQNDFLHPLWIASSQCLFNLLKELAARLPEPPQLIFSRFVNNILPINPIQDEFCII